jgi:lipoyl(octanoyl) transferase
MNLGKGRTLSVVDLSLQRYNRVWDFQRTLQKLRYEQKISDTLIFVEHYPVYTVGKSGSASHIVATDAFLQSKGIEVIHVDRGGDVTYHGPGQIVGYPILDLNQHKTSISWYMRSLEEVLISALSHWGIKGERYEGYTGVWVGEDKIAALGVRISRWVTMHGFALNVNTDLDYFNGIIPCGISHRGVTSIEKVLGYRVDMEEAKNIVLRSFQNVFNFSTVRRDKVPMEEVA